jgi:putative peptidoglycan lipid II flippase
MSQETAPLQPPADDPGRALNDAEIARATVIIMGAFVLSGAMGLVRQIVISAAFGAGHELDAFYAAARVPETLFMLIAGGALGSAFIPVFSGFLGRDDFEGAWRLTGTVLSFVLIIATGLATLAFVLAEPIVANVLVPGGDAADHALTVELMRIMLVTVVLFAISGLIMGILHAHQHFIVPALAPSMYNLGIIGGALLLTDSFGIHGLAWGTVAGAALHLGVQLPMLRKLPHIRLRASLNPQNEGVQEVLRLMLPRVLGLAVVQINFWVNIALASTMLSGSIAALQTAYVLMFTILGILGQSLGTAVFPTLSTQYTTGDEEGFQQTFSTALRNVLFLSIPAGIGLAVLSEPIVGVLFERGEWTHQHTQATSWALIFYALGLAGHAALEILARTFYALHDTWTPVQIGALAMTLNVVLSVVFVLVFEAVGWDSFTQGAFGGLALANSLATALESTILWLILNRRIQTLRAENIVPTMLRTTLAAVVMAVAVGGWLILTEGQWMLLRLLGGIALGGGIFWGVAMALHIEAARAVPQQILGRLRRA